MKLPSPPAEPAADNSVESLAPKFRALLMLVLTDLGALGWRPVLRETMRSDERARWLYGFGREWDDGRGIVTNAPDASRTWHHYGLAADLGDSRYDGGDEPPAFWRDLERCAVQRGLVSGGDWTMRDLPHVQFGGGMRVSPSDEAVALISSGGLTVVWQAVGAMTK